MANIVRTAFELAYEVSPILLEQGIAQNLSGGVLPILSATELFDVPGLLNTIGTGTSTSEFFAHFKPLSGSTLTEWQFAEYPFANMQMAANAVIQMPLKISLAMVAPARTPAGYITKKAQFTALQGMIQSHIQQGGYFTVATPAFIYTNCLLKSIRDITPAGDKQVQYIYQWDFEQPLITEQAAKTVIGGILKNIQNGGLTQGNVTWNSTPTLAPNSAGNATLQSSLP